MFSDDFLESSARVVCFPGVSCSTFRSLLHFLYTDQVPRVRPASAMAVIELANRSLLLLTTADYCCCYSCYYYCCYLFYSCYSWC